MSPRPEVESLATRFAPHIELLQEFFANRNLRFGSPDCVAPLAERLSTPGAFPNEMAAMLRTVIYREHMKLTKGDLLEILSRASGGKYADSAAPALQGARTELSAFITEVLRSLRSAQFDEAEMPVASSATPGATRISTPEAPLSQRPSHAGRPRFSHLAEPDKLSWMAESRRYLNYIVGVCAVLLAFLAGWALHRRADVELAHPGSAVAPALPPGGFAKKPSAYGDPLDGPAATGGIAGQSPSDSAGASVATLPGALTPGDSAAGGNLSDTATASVPALAGEAENAAAPEAASEAEAAESTRSEGVEPHRERRPEEARDAISARSSTRHGLFEVSSGVMRAFLVDAPRPDYPLLARLGHVQGQVVLQAVVDRHGEVATTRVLEGHELLRGAAQSAVRRWRYRPYVVKGRPVNVETIVFVEFQLHR